MTASDPTRSSRPAGLTEAVDDAVEMRAITERQNLTEVIGAQVRLDALHMGKRRFGPRRLAKVSQGRGKDSWGGPGRIRRAHGLARGFRRFFVLLRTDERNPLHR